MSILLYSYIHFIFHKISEFCITFLRFYSCDFWLSICLSMTSKTIKRRCCKNNSKLFCYICDEYIIMKQWNNIANFVKNVYHEYFGFHLGDQDKSWGLHIVCQSCVEGLRNWNKINVYQCLFWVPLVWWEPNHHIDDCYFVWLIFVIIIIKTNQS
jgi:hypothetical protein